MSESGNDIKRATSAVMLLLVLALTAAILSVRLTDHYDGYMSYNEGWYSSLAENYDTHSLLEPTRYDGKTDLKVVPFFSWMLRPAYLLLGRHEWAFRIVAILMGLQCVIATFAIGSLLYGWRAGTMAALLLGVTPIFALTARNVQTDASFLAFTLWGLYVYLLYRRSSKIGFLVLSSLLFGIALFTKQFAVLFFAAFAAAEIVVRRFKFRPGARAFLAVALVAAIPAPFFIYHLVHDPRLLYDSYRYGAAEGARIPTAYTIAGIVPEMILLLGIPTILIAAAAWISAHRRHKATNPYVLMPIIVIAVFYLVLHKHSYYVLGMAPFLALTTGEYLAGMRTRPAMTILTPTVMIGIIGCFLLLGLYKYGYDRFEPMCAWLDAMPGRNVLVVDRSVIDRTEPTIHYYCRRAKVESRRRWVTARHEGRLRKRYGAAHMYFLHYVGRRRRHERVLRQFDRSIMGVNIFGYLVYLNPKDLCRTGSTFPLQVKRDTAAPILSLAKACDIKSLNVTIRVKR